MEKHFHFETVRRKGSHIVLKKYTNGKKIVTVVPNHKDVQRGTLSGILKLAQIQPEEFLRILENK